MARLRQPNELASLLNYLSAVSNLKNGNIKTFDLKYKSRFSNRHIFWVDFRAMKYKNNKWKIFPSKLKNDSILRFRNKNKDECLSKM